MLATSPNQVGQLGLIPIIIDFFLSNKHVKTCKNKQYFTCSLKAWMGFFHKIHFKSFLFVWEYIFKNSCINISIYILIYILIFHILIISINDHYAISLTWKKAKNKSVGNSCIHYRDSKHFDLNHFMQDFDIFKYLMLVPVLLWMIWLKLARTT